MKTPARQSDVILVERPPSPRPSPPGRGRTLWRALKFPSLRLQSLCIEPVNRTVGQAFQPAGSPDFPVRCCWETGDWKVAPTGRQECLPYVPKGSCSGWQQTNFNYLSRTFDSPFRLLTSAATRAMP